MAMNFIKDCENWMVNCGEFLQHTRSYFDGELWGIPTTQS